ncbi:TPA: hypothetical protein ACNADN_005226 [Klebsiella pneumoniae]
MTVTTDPRGLAAMRAIKSIHAAQGSLFRAADAHPDNDQKVKTFLRKAATGALSASGFPLWRNDIVVSELASFVFEQTIPGKLMSRARQLDFNIPFAYLSGIGASWRGEGRAVRRYNPKPTVASLFPHSIDGVAIVTEESLITGGAGTETALRDELANAIIRNIDVQFCSAVPGIPEISPAGILNGQPDRPEAGNGADAVRIMTQERGFATRNLIAVYPSVHTLMIPVSVLNGYKNLGIPVLSSDTAETPFLIDVSALAVNIGGVELSTSNQALIEIDEVASADSVTPTPVKSTELINTWQTNSIAVKAGLFCDWALIDPAAVLTFAPDFSLWN